MKNLFTLFLFISSATVNSQIDNNVYQVDTTIQTEAQLKGNLRTVEWISESFGESRKISIYEPVGFHRDSVYNLIVITDNQCEALANILENRVNESLIKPVIIIGIHNREPQPIDSILKGYKVDFRSKEMLGCNYWFGENVKLSTDSVAVKLIMGRLEKYKKWVAIEVVDFLLSHYYLSSNDNWTIGGYSNGGTVVADICSSYPNVFGNIISMSPGSSREFYFDFSQTKSKFYICAGKNEKGFHERSLELTELLLKNKVCFKHKTFDAGHSYEMWMTYYLECLIEIYKI